MVGNKRGKKEKKRKECGYVCGGEKKRGEKKGKKGRRAHVCGEKKKRKCYYNIFTINLKVGYY